MSYNLQPSYPNTDALSTQDKALSVLYGRLASDGSLLPIAIDSSGRIVIGTGVTLSVSDLQIGAVEIKDNDTDNRIDVITLGAPVQIGVDNYRGFLVLGKDPSNNAATFSFDSSGNLKVAAGSSSISGNVGLVDTTSTQINPAREDGNLLTIKNNTSSIASSTSSIDSKLPTLTSQLNGLQYALDVGINVGGVQIDPRSIRLLTASDVVTANQGGTWNINNISGTISLPTGASTSLLQTTGNASLASIDSKLNSLGQKTSANSVPVVIASDQTAVPISGTVTANIGTTNGLALDSSLQSILTDLNQFTFSSTRLLVDGSGVIQPVSGTVTANIGTTGGLALDATLTGGTLKSRLLDGSGNAITSQVNGAQRALDVGIDVAGVQVDPRSIRALTSSDTVTVVQTTPANLQATVTPASGAIFDENLKQVGGTAVSLGQKVMASSIPVTLASDQTALPVSQSGSWTVSLTTESIEIGTVDQGTPNTIGNAWPVKPTDGTNSQSYTASGEAKVSVTQPLPVGTNTIGNVNAIQSGAWTTGRTWTLSSGTDSISAVQSGTWNINNISGTISLPTGAATELTLAGIKTDTDKFTFAATRLLVDGSGVTQPVSGTVTANIGTTNGLALDASVTGLQVSQGSTTSGQKGGLTLGAVTTAAPAYTTAQTSPLSLTTAGALRVDGSAVTQPVSGTVTANAGTGNFTVVQATGTNLHAVVDSGTITANIGTTNGLALDATLAKLTITQGAALDSNTQALIGASVTTAAPAYTTGQISPLSLTTSGSLRTDSSATTQPVSGTVSTTLQTSSTATLTNVAGSGSNVTILASNSSRKMATIFNDSTHAAAVLYLKFGTTASTSSHTVQIDAGSYYEFPTPIYTGNVDGLWSTNTTATARVTEFT